MTPSPRHDLLDDTLHPDALARSLAAVRRTARRRRMTRHAVRAATAVAMLTATLWFLVPTTPPTVVMAPPPSAGPAPAASPAAPASHQLVTTTPAAAPVVVRTVPAPRVARTATPGVQIVSSRTTTPALTRATEDDLFAAAGSRPAALYRPAGGAARWVWLDQSQPPK